MKKIITLIFVIGCTIITLAQERIISGVVSDDMGPVADISIMIRGTNNGTVTDFDGNYSIKAKTGDVLVFSHISYNTEERKVDLLDEIDVVMDNEPKIIWCEFYPTYYGRLGVGYFRSFDNSFNGLTANLSYSFNKFKIGVIPRASYKTDFKNNRELHVELSLDLKKQLFKSTDFDFDLSFNELKIDKFVNKDFQFALNSYFRFTPKRETWTTISLILGLTNNDSKEVGFGFGVRKRIFNNIRLFAKIINYRNYFDIQNKIAYDYKRFSFFVEHKSIKHYENIIYGIGYEIKF